MPPGFKFLSIISVFLPFSSGGWKGGNICTPFDGGTRHSDDNCECTFSFGRWRFFLFFFIFSVLLDDSIHQPMDIASGLVVALIAISYISHVIRYS